VGSARHHCVQVPPRGWPELRWLLRSLAPVRYAAEGVQAMLCVGKSGEGAVCVFGGGEGLAGGFAFHHREKKFAYIAKDTRVFCQA